MLNNSLSIARLRPAAVALLSITGVQVFLGVIAYVARINAASIRWRWC